MQTSCWTILGIVQTDDLRMIKRAYLANLKSIKPDEDIEGFQVLRAAYEQAQALATSASVSQVTADGSADVPPVAWTDAADMESADFQDGLAARREEMAIQVSRLLTQTDIQAVPAMLQYLWSHSRWGALTLQDMLERLLLQGLAECSRQRLGSAHLLVGDGIEVIAMLVAECSLYYQWFNRSEAYIQQHSGDLLGLLEGLLQGECEVCWALVRQGEIDAAARRLKDRLESPLFRSTEMRLRLEAVCAAALAREAVWPDAWVNALSEIFGWNGASKPYPEAVRARFRREFNLTLLPRLAQSEQGGVVSREVAKALLVKRVAWMERCVAVGRNRQKQMYAAIVWLKRNAPDALETVEPSVLAWWSAPRAVFSYSWLLFGLVCWILANGYLNSVVRELDTDVMIGLRIADFFLTPVIACYLAWLFAGLRLFWVLRCDLAWREFDRRLVERLFGYDILEGWGLDLTRHLLPLPAIFVWLGFVVVRSGKSLASLPDILGALLALLFMSLACGGLWALLLAWFALAPAAKTWRAFQLALKNTD